MSLFNPKKEWILWVLIIAPVLYTVYIWNQLPDQIPTHWNFKGEIDGYGGKGTMILLPCINVFLYLLMLFIPKIDPRKANYDVFSGPYYGIRISTTAVLDLIFLGSIRATLTGHSDFMDYIPAAISLLFALMGYFMKDVKPNYFVGIRTPWTLESPEVWEKTHKLGGKIWLYGGIISFVLCLVLGKYSFFVFIPIILIMAIVPIVYSYVEYKRITRE